MTVVAAGQVLPVTLSSLVTKATFENAGIRVAWVGTDTSTVVQVEYRAQGETQWRRGHPMIRIAGNRMATSLFWLGEGTTYEARLVVDPPASLSASFAQPFSFATRSSAFPAGSRDLYVDPQALIGGDGSQSRPFRTIGEAAAVAVAGDVVHVAPRTYPEEVRPANSGTASAWIQFVADDSGVVLDGGQDIATGSGWTDEGGGVYSTPYAGTTNFATLDGIRLYQHAGLDSLRADADGITGGYCIAGGVLYVKPPDGSPIAGRTLRLAVEDYGFCFDNRSFIAVRGFDITHFDRNCVRVRNSHHVSISDCRISQSRTMVSVDGITSTDNLVENCVIWGTGVTAWPWAICHHDHDCSSNGVTVSNAGEGNVVRNNHCRGLFNGIYVGQWTTAYPDENALENDVYGNVLEEIVDDGLEPECKGINLRMYRNRFRHVYSPISLAPIETGPTWVLYTVVDGFWEGSPGWDEWGGAPGWIKIATTPSGERPMGALRIYHNTAYVTEADHNGWGSTGSGYTHLKNNIVRATRYVFENTNPNPYPPGNEWDYNNFYTTGTQYVKWENVRLDTAGFRALGQQVHGISAPPVFENAAGGDFRLAVADPGVDKGVVLSGINDGYAGAAPDMGAFERGAGPVRSPWWMAGMHTVHIAGSGSGLRVSGLRPGRYRITLTDLAGRVCIQRDLPAAAPRVAEVHLGRVCRLLVASVYDSSGAAVARAAYFPSSR